MIRPDLIPPAVELRFLPPDPDRPLDAVRVAIHDRQTAELLAVETLRRADQWLNARGLRYVPGTNAVWARVQ